MMKKTRRDLEVLMLNDPVVYNGLIMHYSNPEEFSYEDALIAMVFFFAKKCDSMQKEIDRLWDNMYVGKVIEP